MAIIKVKGLLFELSDRTNQKLEDMQQIYDEAVQEYERQEAMGVPGATPPKRPVYETKKEDYTITAKDCWMNTADIITITFDKDDYGIIKLKDEIDVMVEGSEVESIVEQWKSKQGNS